MNHMLNQSVRQYLRLGLLCLIALSFGSPAARAGLTVDIHLYHDTYGYYFYPWLNVNTNTPNFPTGNYMIASPQIPTNGSQLQYQATNNTLNYITGGGSYYGDFNSFLYGITNGQWSIWVTNSTSTNQYKFTVTVSGVTSNVFGASAVAVFPTNGAQFVINQPLFQWTGPANWAGALNVSDYLIDTNGNWNYEASASLPLNQTSWPCPTVLPNGTNDFSADYTSNVTAQIVASTPLINGSQPISGWVSTATLETRFTYDSQFTVGQLPVAGGGHTLIAHYAFDDSGNHGLDSSGNGNDIECGSSWGPGEVFSTDAIAGAGALQFFGGSSITPCGQAFTSWTNTLAGSFTVSAWIKTTSVVGNDGDDLSDGNGQSVVYADNNNLGATPVALTGTKAAFRTTDPDGNDDTLHSLQSVTTGDYVHIVATRDQLTGEKKIYINGTLDSSDVASTESLTGAQYVSIGGEGGSAYIGLVDDVQIYSGVLSDSEVANLYANPGSTAPNVSGNSGGHTNLAYYAFEDNTVFTADLSGHGNGIAYAAGYGNGACYTTNVPAAGNYAIFFFNNGGAGASWLGANTNLLSTLAGSFSVSLWLKTTQISGSDTDDGTYGNAGIVSALTGSSPNFVIPMALTGGKLAFVTGGATQDTLQSATSINTGQYVHLVVTRNQGTGQKSIYVNGVLDASDIAGSDLLNGPNDLDIGEQNLNGYQGEMDEIQIYSGVLSASEVAYLYNHPGTAVADVSGNSQDFAAALGTTNLNWSNGGDTSWFVESTNTYNGSSAAAQSGSVINSQFSKLSVTVTGPGTLTFYWASLDDCNNFDYEFDIDGNYQNDIYCSQSWVQDGPYTISAGQHTLSWTTYAYGDNDPTEAGFLDQVSYVQVTAPIITLNPFNQTNYPGYNVGLLAAATNAANSLITWQWFEVGNASPIPNATNALFIPTNSGTAGVVGSYYAVASTPGGSTPTTAASVSFVSASLPPDWAHALKSPFFPVDGSVFNKDYYLGCAVDSAGDIYAAAFYVGNMNVVTNGNDANVLTAVGANGAAALVKHDANGNALWAVGLTNNQSTSSSYGQCVAPAPGNGAYLASILQGTNWLGTNKFVDAGGGSILLSRFNASGSNVWSKFIGGTNSIYIGYNMLVSDASGNVTLAGHMSGTVSFGGTNLSSPAGGGFIVQYDANGAVRWAQTIPVYTYGLAYGNGLLYVSLQSAVISGVTNASIGSLSNVTDRAWAVACLNATNGQPLWLRGVGHPYGANFSGLINDMPLIAVSGTNVFLTANAYGSSVVFGSLSVPLPGGRGQYFARYDTNGTPRAASVFGSPTTMIWASAANASGVYVSGDFDSYSQFGNLVIAAPVFTTNDLDFSYNGFDYIYFTQPLVAKFDLNGNPLWARNGVSSAFANFRGIATTSDGVWASGFLKVKDISSPAQFGTNYVSSDLYVPGVGVSTINFTQAGMIAKIGESGGASPVTLLNPQDNGVNFQFQFQSQAGVTNSVQYRTNLVIGNWLTYTNVTGDGTLKTSMIPLSVFSPSKQGFIRVSTQ
jgi:hypothetical protein